MRSDPSWSSQSDMTRGSESPSRSVSNRPPFKRLSPAVVPAQSQPLLSSKSTRTTPLPSPSFMPNVRHFPRPPGESAARPFDVPAQIVPFASGRTLQMKSDGSPLRELYETNDAPSNLFSPLYVPTQSAPSGACATDQTKSFESPSRVVKV